MAIFAINFGNVVVPVAADDFRFEPDGMRLPPGSIGGSPMMMKFANYNGVVLDRFLALAGAAAPAAQVVAADYWIPAAAPKLTWKLSTGAAAAEVAPGSQTKNVFLVIPKTDSEGRAPYTASAGVMFDYWPLFAADGFEIIATSRRDGRWHTRAMAGFHPEGLLSFTNYRGRVLWSQLAAPPALPAVISGEGDYHLPIDSVAAVFRIRNQLWP